jgi:hypothetical protein
MTQRSMGEDPRAVVTMVDTEAQSAKTLKTNRIGVTDD